MLILTEKPSVAKDFARALGCHFSSKEKAYTNNDDSIVIANCVGHLFQLEEPAFYASRPSEIGRLNLKNNRV